ncbi:hypothetical protein MGG_15955 [Pyricularia oryzae 70-15]|uniref:Uncharacterized protein n=1 Tax=Pyricularia oryzae (strain 70-15 / ATCC MYA-4617 / FGSC 8958) TaxID=242507 RepID=G4MX73_PYRO7|nr:uncharacterized protein MGG_15955 [Pyricularia oryzae 70-15]EHA55971.1 hypothetical protein MGG_15955 [Pyricularia oryzae 70-15]
MDQDMDLGQQSTAVSSAAGGKWNVKPSWGLVRVAAGARVPVGHEMPRRAEAPAVQWGPAGRIGFHGRGSRGSAGVSTRVDP